MTMAFALREVSRLGGLREKCDLTGTESRLGTPIADEGDSSKIQTIVKSREAN
jgi:hypothetical protein